METLKQDLLDKTEKAPLESKKILSALFAVVAIVIIWLGTLICMFLKIEGSSQFVSLATITISSVAALATAVVTGQTAMEWKSMSTISTVDTNDKEEKKIINLNLNKEIKEEGQNGSPEVKPFGETAK